MTKEIQVVAFEGGELFQPTPVESGREVVLALPLSRLIARIVRVPAEADAVETATPILQQMSPFPDEPLTVSCETVRELPDGGRIVIAAALPESAAEDVADALDQKKLHVVRVDALVLGQLREVWQKFDATDGKRRLIRIKSSDCLSLIVLDGDQPLAIRALSDESELKREEMLLLLEAEDFGGPKPLAETIEATPSSEGTFAGIAERSLDAGAINAIPASWQEYLEETRFKNKLIRNLAIAGGVWILIMATLFGVPVVYGFMTDHQKSLSREHQRQYRAVSEMKAKVDLVRKYSDHARGALEIMKAVSDRVPEGITLTSWSFKRDEGVRLSGEADDAAIVYDFKNKMAEMAAGEEEEAQPVFTSVTLNGPSAIKGGRQKFDLDLSYATEEAP